MRKFLLWLIIPKGWHLVPGQITRTMNVAGFGYASQDRWEKLIAAAPQYPKSPESDPPGRPLV
jgi:hypothetical protein